MHDSFLTLFPERYPFPLWEAFLRIALAALLGAVIGLERERRKQPAGLRTHAVLSIGATLITLVSIYTSYTYGGLTADPSRITAQIVSGIGFLGAGAILRFGVTIKGLTTAASLWSTAGLGIAVGTGMYTLAMFTTFVMLLFLTFVSKIERELLKSKGVVHLKLTISTSPEVLYKVNNLLENGKILKAAKKENLLEVVIAVQDYGDLPEKLEELLKLKGVKEVEII
ncbi:MAG: MgtC/SapB family protein [Aquifex sp.]|nr:MAG: MgtC/SapB family protein [Aquifex sp.]